MKRYFLTSLQVEGFRGINNEGDPLTVRFRTDCINSIFGANAQGKSSLSEAICYAITGKIKKLEELPATERGREYYCNKFHSLGNASIVLKFASDDGTEEVAISVELSKGGARTVTSPSGHSDPQKFLEALNSQITLLDHQTFIDFVSDSPLIRGRSFASLLGLADLSIYRQALEVLSNSKNLNSDFSLEALAQRLEQAEVSLSKLITAMAPPYKALVGIELTAPFDVALTVAKATEALKGMPLIRDHLEKRDLMSVNFLDIRATIHREENGTKRERLAEILAIIRALDDLRPQDVEEAEFQKATALIAERDDFMARTNGDLFKSLYTTATKIMELEQWSNKYQCPACENIADEMLEPALREKLGAYEGVNAAQQKLAYHWKNAVWARRLLALESLESMGIKQEDRNYGFLDSYFRMGAASKEHLRDAISALTALELHRTITLDRINHERDSIESTLPPSLVALTEQVANASRLQELLGQYERQTILAHQLRSSLSLRKKWESFIGLAAKVFSLAEVELSTARTIAIETSYHSMYEKITNNPMIVPGLKKQGGTEELHLTLSQFYGLNDAPAAPLLSESHRNALAISIFLSSMLQSKAVPRFLILDDVTSSFDAGHQFALMELLRNEVGYPSNPSGPQIVLLSHDGLLEKYFDKMGSSVPNWHHQCLHGTPPVGPIICQFQDSNRVRDNASRFLQAGQVKPAEPYIRQYLEFKLLQVIRSVSIPVPFDFAIRDDRHMVSNCLEAITAAVMLHYKAKDLILTDPQFKNLTTIHVPALTANWIAHYETSRGSSISAYVLLGILDTIDQYAACFMFDCTCRVPGTPTRVYYKTLARKGCRC
jgi:hypothetical protein